MDGRGRRRLPIGGSPYLGRSGGKIEEDEFNPFEDGIAYHAGDSTSCT